MKKDIFSICYLNDVYEDFCFEPKHYVNARRVEDRKMGLRPYRDPDRYSKKLYEAIRTIWNGKRLPNGEVFSLGEPYCHEFPFGTCWQIDDEEGNFYGSDFIGPSFTGAYVKLQKNVDSKEEQKINEQLGQLLYDCRRIGGHIIWPRLGQEGINLARAVTNDRMDVTLLELRDFYAKPDGAPLYNAKLRAAFRANRKYLMMFEDFDGFIDFFMLRDSFVGKNGAVKIFGPIYIEEDERKRDMDRHIYDLFRPDDYLAFMYENADAIKRRTELMSKVC